MIQIINEHNFSLAWLASMEHLFHHQGTETNLIVTIADATKENIKMREELDKFIAMQKDSRKGDFQFMSTIANTIFPQALYLPKLGDGARRHLYDHYLQGFPIIQRIPANYRGTYFHRMINWPGKLEEQEVNQLERVVKNLKRELAKPRKNVLSSIYEIGISDIIDEPGETLAIVSPGYDIRVQNPNEDTFIMGFPCLSHISLTYSKDRLHLTALYRNQHFIRKAYGNYLGLCRLLQFICNEAGCNPGELVCIATHADAEFNLGKRAIESLIQRCQNILNEV